MGSRIRDWFERLKKPKHEFVAYAVMLSWHPGVGFAAHDPLTGRHFSHRPGTTVINNFPSPAKLAADYFPATPMHRMHLPRELSGTITYNHSLAEVSRQGGGAGIMERYELQAGNGLPFVFQRSINPDGTVELEASYGQLSNRHADTPRHAPQHSLQSYLENLRTFARRMLPGNALH